MMKSRLSVFAGVILLAFSSLIPAVQDSSTGKTNAMNTTPITVTRAGEDRIEVIIESVGVVSSIVAPVVSAEVSGRITSLFVDIGDKVAAGAPLAQLDDTELRLNREAAAAEVMKTRAEIANQLKVLERFRKLKKNDYLSRTQLDEAETRLIALREQLKASQAQLAISEDKLQHTSINAPVSGSIDERMVSQGDFVKVGDPIFRLTTTDRLRAQVDFPETAVGKLRTGQTVYLRSPLSSDKPIRATVGELRPTIESGNKATTVIVDFDNPGIFKPGASIVGKVVLEERTSAVVVPSLSVVRRPAGDVVYVIENNVAQQRLIKCGEHLGNSREILDGLKTGEMIALDGAGFLTDGAPVQIQPEN